ncbi:hypothetical protein [Kurthia huakuii]|uniref:hypothetical protein n=1 Tax=Kurthia huakuii TaxID=1421019 RepID=UPI000496FDCE|nr:hypothetical protein [Kurthia huakuii]MBM7700895.1 hypothetical protein [Kurthia huakuii]
MFWIAIVLIVAISVTGGIVEKAIKSKERTKKMEIEMMREQIKLEELKYKNFQIETDKMRLELKKDLQDAPTKEDLLNVDLTKHQD